jgi:D-alanyl-D-alanine carboxypeptidase/D-alanyl-D-alanine-endopeptidase (penicillin-binding protein 4)
MRFLLLFLLLSYPFYSWSKAPEVLSYALVDLETGKIVEAKNAKRSLTLASVSKLFTTYYALSILGADFHFKTTVHTNGKVKDGVLKGDLFLVGSGDPYLTAQHLVSLIHQIKSFGIQKVEGNFYLDDTALSFTPRISGLGLEDQPDNPSMGALNVEFNRMTMFARGKKLHPPLANIEINQVDKKEAGLKFDFIKFEGQKEFWQVNSKEKIKYVEDFPSRNSTFFTGNLFKYLATMHGLVLPSPKLGTLGKNSKKVAYHQGLSLYRIVSLGVEYSNNVIAEALLQTAANKQTGRVLTSEAAAKEMLNWFKKKFNQLKWSETQLQNGSGLTLNNTTNAEFLAKYLREVAEVKFQGRSFWSLLSINAHSGGLSKRIRDPQYAYRVYGKTGSLYYVNNLAGYLIGKSNKHFAYAIFSEHSKNRKVLNNGNSKISNKLRKQSKQWYGKSTKQMDDLLVRWINKY